MTSIFFCFSKEFMNSSSFIVGPFTLKTEKSRFPRRLNSSGSLGMTAGSKSATAKLRSGSGAAISEMAFARKVVLVLSEQCFLFCGHSVKQMARW